MIMRTDIRELEQDIADNVALDFEDIISSDYPTDRLHEIADYGVPIYNYELAQMLANDFTLAYVDDEGCVEGVTDVFKIISFAIYERLLAAAYEAFGKLKEDKLEHLAELQDDIEKKLDLIDGAISELINGDLSTVTKVEHYLIDELKEEHDEVTEEHETNAIIIHHLENNC